MLYKIENAETLLKDKKNSSVIETDQAALEKYMTIKRSKRNITKRIDALECNIKSIEEKLDAILQLVSTHK
jgi:hypothetical protein